MDLILNHSSKYRENLINDILYDGSVYQGLHIFTLQFWFLAFIIYFAFLLSIKYMVETFLLTFFTDKGIFFLKFF